MVAITGYVLEEKLGSNTQVDIYRGIRQRDNRKVILKLSRHEHPSSPQLAALQHEYHLLKQLRLPGIIQIYEIIQVDHMLVLVLENLEGITLKNYLAAQPLGLDRFFDLTLQLVDIIGALHQRHIIHKDINPSIIIVEPDLNLKLLDLSISTQLSEETQEYSNLRQLEGTLAYISPEQTGRMNRPIDYRTDFYSLGVTFFEMLTGQLPFQADDALEMVHAHIAKTAPLVTEHNSQAPAIVAQIVAKLLAKMPEERYASVVGLKADLLKCAEQWRQQGQIENFQLGQKDIHDHLHVSHTLYGREKQVKQLLTAFEQVSQGALQLVLIAGYSGVGKTSLVREIHKPIVWRKGYFIQGKFDQLQRGMPYSAIVTAFQSLVKQVLAEHETKLLQFKQALIAALGNAAQVIIDVIPEIELIIGEQPPIAALNLAEAQRRFNLIFQKFVRVFAQADHPLAIFLDDLQWADTASLKLIEILLTDPETHYLLILGVYRDNEVDSTHPLITSVQQLQKADVHIKTLILQPLQSKDVEQLLADSLNCPCEKVIPLATCIYEKTQGNPFFINEFLKTIYQQHLLTFSYELGQWQWELEKIKQQGMMDNVINLLTTKIHQLPATTQELLKLAACIGHQFSLQTLAIISEQDLLQTALQLWEAIQINLIFPLEEANKTMALIESDNPISFASEQFHYRFAHDRIQQASIQLIPDDIKQKTHLKIGRLLLKQQPLQSHSEMLFEVVDHFNQSLSLLDDIKEKHELAQYNLWAGKKAKLSTAYQAAKAYLQAGITLLEPISWQDETEYELAFTLYKELSACKYLTGEFQQAAIEFEKLIKHANNLLDKIDIYQLNIQMLSTLNQHPEAIKLGLNALRLLNINLPEKANTFHILRTVLRIKMQMQWRNTSKIKLLPIKNAEHRAAIDLVTQLLNNAFISDQRLFILLACTDVNLSLEYGYTESTSMALLVYAFTLMHALNWFSEGFSFVDLYTRLKQNYSEANFAGRNHLVLGTFIDPWRLPLSDSLETLLSGQQIANDVGDIVYSNYCNVVAIITAFLMGKPLPEVKNYIHNALIFISRAKISDFQHVTHFWQYAVQSLETSNNFELDKLIELEQGILTAENKTGISFFYSTYTKLCYLLGHFSEARQAASKQERYAEYALGILSNLENEFYYALAITADLKAASQRQHLRKLKKIHTYIKRCANQYPANFKHYLLLLDAELARINNQIAHAIDLYQQAIAAAQEQNALHLIAIANECAGNFYIRLKAPHFAKLYFSDAYSAYKNWGAWTKCRQLEQTYPEWFSNHNALKNSIYFTPVTSVTETSQTLDMLAILKFTQVISSEIHVDKLLQKLLAIVLEDAGAQRCVLLLMQDGRWLVEADGNVEKQQINLTQAQAADTRKDLPLSLVYYVQRTQKPVIVQEATHEELTMNDPYIQSEKPQSLLMMPLLYQGQLRRILYLENKSSSHVFTMQHLQNLQFLASQAVISLENAYLYYQASHDPLTGLANRSLLYQMFQYYAGYMTREKKQMAVLFLDIDYFKSINDTLGHEIGDQLLKFLAEQFQKSLREGDILARLGGDEFVIMLTGIEDSKEVMVTADRVYQRMANPINLLGHEFWISTSMGIGLYPNDGTDIQTLLKRADIALYRAKETGRNQYRFYSTELEAQHQQAHISEIELQHAFERQEFCMYYQPIFNVKTNQLSGLEALLRWQHPKKGLLSAELFIDSVEKSLLIDSIGRWILRTVCQQAKHWQEQGLLTIPIAVNISPVQFKKQSLSRLITNILQEMQLESKYLELELTETAFIENNEKMLIESHDIQKSGVCLVLDDFGTGYANLTYLKQLPVNKLKIDRSFVQNCESDVQSKAIIEAIITMAHSLGLTVIGEGIENEVQLNYLREHQIDAVQGFYLYHPLSTEQCEKLLHLQKK